MKSKLSKIISRKSLKTIVSRLKENNKTVVFTNGCFDLLHVGHVQLFYKAKSYGDVLVVAINSDASMRRLKGKERPLVNEKSRRTVIAALEPVDYVVVFGEDTPAEIIKELKPDILVKGGDYKINQIVGRENVKKVIRFPVVAGYSTTNLIKKIIKAYGK